MANELLKTETAVATQNDNATPNFFEFYTSAYKVASLLSKSDLIPQTFQKRTENCMIALEMSQRIGASPLMVMQNLYIVHGKPAWSSQFLVACVNASKKFSPLRYKMTGKKGDDSYGCIAWAKDASGETLESPEVTIGMAKKEGWFSKNGSKWQTMPELMLRYRCATLFARLYAPELTMGIHTEEEVIDVQPIVTEARPSRFEQDSKAAKVEYQQETPKAEPSDVEKLQSLIDEKRIPATAEDVKAYVESKGEIFSFDMIAPNINQIVEKMISGE